MKIIDLTDAYCKYILEEDNLPKYILTKPELFKHYFKYWADKKYWHKTLKTPAEVKKHKKLITSRLHYIEKSLFDYSFSMDNIIIILFVGQNTTNGHAMFEKNNVIVWFPIEAYQTKSQVDVFVIHEIVHAIHYAKQKEFYFKSLSEKRLLSRQLITEGLATFVTQKILSISEGKALWADYLKANEMKKWLKDCQSQEAELKKYISKNYNSSNKKIELFFANDEKNILKYRGGYYAGLHAIESIVSAEKYNLNDLLKLSPKKFDYLLFKYYLDR